MKRSKVKFALVIVVAVHLLALVAVCRADDPPKPAPVVPVASITVPSTPPLVLLADGAVSRPGGLSWVLISPKGAAYRVEGSALIVLNPQPGVSYRFAQIAAGDTPPFAFDFADVTVPLPSPVVVPPVPAPDDPPPPAQADASGMAAATRAILATRTWSGEALMFRRTTLANCYASQAVVARSAPHLQTAISSTGLAIHQVIPAAGWDGWKKCLTRPLEDKLQALVESGAIETPTQFGQALADVAAALKGK